jgi:hypothetical protein
VIPSRRGHRVFHQAHRPAELGRRLFDLRCTLRIDPRDHEPCSYSQYRFTGCVPSVDNALIERGAFA